MSIQLYVYVYTFILIIDWRFVTSASSDSRMTPRQYQAEFDSNYRGIIEEALNTNVAEGILDRQEKDENQHLRNSLLDQYQHEYMEEEPRKRGESDEPRADPSSLNKRSLHHRYNNSENVDEILNSRETQRLIMENDEEEKGHVLDALDADYSFEEKQLHKAQSDVLRKITEDKIDQQANEDIGQQGVNEVSEQKAENEVDEQKAENEVGAQKAENEVGEQKAENEVGEQKAENEVSEQTNDDSEQEGDDKDSTEEPMKKDIVTNVKKYQKADLKQGNGEQRGVKKSHATLEQEQQNHARNMATKLNSEIDRTVFHNKSSQLKRKSIARKSNTRTNHTVNKRFSDEDLSDSMQEDLKSVLAQQIIARGAETERQEIIESLRKDGSYNQDLLSNIQADLLTKMKKRNRISSKREHGASATGALEKLKGHRISKRLSEEDDEQSIFAKDQIAAEERREREHVLRAMSDDYSLDPMQIQLVEKQLLEKMQGNPENNDDIRLNKYDIENNIEDPNPENIIPDQGPIEENSRKRTRTYSYRPKSEGEESLQAKGFELDDNNRKKGNIEDTGSAVNDAIKKAISAISKSLDGETKRKKTIKEVFADHVANSDNEAAVAAVTAAAVASTLVDYKGKLKKSKDIAIDLDNKKIEGAQASSKKDLLRERNKSPENALKAMLPEYLMNTNTTNYIMDEKGRLKEDSLSHAFSDDLSDPFAEASQDDDSSLNNGVTEAQNGNRESGEKKSLGDPVLVHDSIQRAVEPDNPMQMHEMEKIMEHQNQVGYATGLDKLSHDLVDEHDKYANMNLRPNSIGMSPLVDDYADDQGDEDDDADNADNNGDDDDDDEGEEDPDSKSNVPADENLVMGPDGVLRKEDEKTMKEVHKKHHHHHHRRHKKQGRRGGWGGEDGGEGGDGGDGGGTALLSALFQNGAKRHHHHHRHHHNRHEFYHINQKPNHVFNHITMKMEDDSEPEGGLTFAGEIINPCENGGVYVPAKLNHYNCICPMKFMGKKCSDVNYCHNSPCKNCGRCQLSHEWPHYVCECCLKYSGKHCEVPNPCEPNPCLNGGECTHDGKTPFCVCRSKFNGKNCENINNCSPNPCKNGGQCVEAKAPDNYICNCPYEWSGTTCEAASHCASNPCQNEATCTEKENDFDCECPEGYIGKRCARKLCTPNPCQNRGRCIEDGKDFHCICPNWVKGKTCTDISPCLINPCKHNGRCVDIFSGFRWTLSPMQYYCLCPAPFRGPHCEVDQCKLCDPRAHCEIDHCVCDEGYTGDGMTCHIIPLPCHPNPCLNGGVCVDEGSDYFHCKCKFPYQLPHCQEIDVCKPDPCMNGQCVATSNKVYKCMCHAGFTGKTCKDLQLCQPNPCEHGGACGMISSRSFNCSCPGMWHGNLCEKCGCPVSTDGSRPNSYCNLQDYEYRSCECPGEWSYDRGHMMCIKQRLNACQKRPCLFGGTCRDDPYSVQGYKCECKPENFGDICEKTRYCSSKRTNPCANGGICMDVGPNKYKCQCTDAFQGANCSESTRSMMDAMNHCRPNPCEHSGVCIQIGNSYDCKCLTRYTGPQCGVDKCKDCDEHAKCIGGECICRYGFVGTGYECAPRECPVKCSDQEYCVQSQCVCVPGYVKSANGGCKKGKLHASRTDVTASPKGIRKATLPLLKTAHANIHAKPTNNIARLSHPQHSNEKLRKPALVQTIPFLHHSRNMVTPGISRSKHVDGRKVTNTKLSNRQRDRNVHGQAISDLVEDGDDVKGLYKVEENNTPKLQSHKKGKETKGVTKKPNSGHYHPVSHDFQDAMSVTQGEGITILIPTERNKLHSQRTMKINKITILTNKQTAKPHNLPKNHATQTHNKFQKPTQPHNKLQNQKTKQQQEKQQQIKKPQMQHANQAPRKLPHQQQTNKHKNTLQNQLPTQSPADKTLPLNRQAHNLQNQQQSQPHKSIQDQKQGRQQENMLNQKPVQSRKVHPSNKLQTQHKPQPDKDQHKPLPPDKSQNPKIVQSHNVQKQDTGGQIHKKLQVQHQQTKPLINTLQGQSTAGPHMKLQNQKAAQPHNLANQQKIQPQKTMKKKKVPQRNVLLLLHADSPQAVNNLQSQKPTETHNKLTEQSSRGPRERPINQKAIQPHKLQSQASLHSHETLQKQKAIQVQKFQNPASTQQNKLPQKQGANPAHEVQYRTPAKPNKKLQKQAIILPHKSKNQLLAQPTTKIQFKKKPQPSNKLKQVSQPHNQLQPHRGVVSKTQAGVHGKPLSQQKVEPRVRLLQNRTTSLPHKKFPTQMVITLHSKLDSQQIAQIHKNFTTTDGISANTCNDFSTFLNSSSAAVRSRIRDGKMSPECRERFMKALWTKLQTKLKHLWYSVYQTKSKSKTGLVMLARILHSKAALLAPPRKTQPQVSLVTPPHLHEMQSKVSLVTPPHSHKAQSKVSLVTPPHKTQLKANLVTPPHGREVKKKFETFPHKTRFNVSFVMLGHKPQSKQRLNTPTLKRPSVKSTKNSRRYKSQPNNSRQINKNGISAVVTKLLEKNHIKDQYRNRKLNVPFTYNDMIRLDLTPHNVLAASHHRVPTSRQHNISLLEYDEMLNRKWLSPANNDDLDVRINVTFDDNSKPRPKHKHRTSNNGERLQSSKGLKEGIVPLKKIHGLTNTKLRSRNDDDILMNINATNNASNYYAEQEPNSNDNTYVLQLNDDDTKLLGDADGHDLQPQEYVGNTIRDNNVTKKKSNGQFPFESHLYVSLPNNITEESSTTPDELETKFEIEDLPDNNENIKERVDKNANYNKHPRKTTSKILRKPRKETFVLTNNPIQKESARRHDLALAFQKPIYSSSSMERKLASLDSLLLKDRNELDYSSHLIPGEETGEMGLVDDPDDVVMNFELNDDLAGNYMDNNRSYHKYPNRGNKKRANQQVFNTRKDALSLGEHKVEDDTLTVFGDHVISRKKILSFGSDKVSHSYKEDPLQVNHKVDNKLTSFRKDDKATYLKKDDKATYLKKDDKATYLKKDDKPRGGGAMHDDGTKSLYDSNNRSASVNITNVPQGSLKNNKGTANPIVTINAKSAYNITDVRNNNSVHANISKSSDKERKGYTTPSKEKSHNNEKPTTSSHQIKSTNRIDQKQVTKRVPHFENIEKDEADILKFQIYDDTTTDDNDADDNIDIKSKNKKSSHGENTSNKDNNDANKNNVTTYPLKQTYPRKETLILTNRKLTNNLQPGLFGFQVYDDTPGHTSPQNNKHINSRNGGTTTFKNDQRNKSVNPVEYLSHKNGNQKVNNNSHSVLHPFANRSSEGSNNRSNHVHTSLNVFDLSDLGAQNTKKIPTRKASTRAEVTGETARSEQRDKTNLLVPLLEKNFATKEAIYPHIEEGFDSYDEETVPTSHVTNNSVSNTSLRHNDTSPDKINMSSIDYMVRYNGTEVDRFRLHDESQHVTFLNDIKPDETGEIEDVEGHSYNKGSKQWNLVDDRTTSTDDDDTDLGDIGDAESDMFTLKFNYNGNAKDIEPIQQNRDEHARKRQFTINNAVAKQPNAVAKQPTDDTFFNLQLDDS